MMDDTKKTNQEKKHRRSKDDAMQCDEMLLARYHSMSGRLLAADGWIDR